MLKQCLENIGEGLLHACISSKKMIFCCDINVWFGMMTSHAVKKHKPSISLLKELIEVSGIFILRHCDIIINNYYSLYYFLVFLLVESLQIIFRISVQT